MHPQAYQDRASASAAAAETLAAALEKNLRTNERATLVVSGGSTPRQCFADLAGAALPWSRVDVTLTDERCVPVDHEDSNQRMVREHLLIGNAAAARFVAIEKVSEGTFAAVLLGMGTDGHFASIFPDADNLTAALSPDNTDCWVATRTAASPHRRLSMTLTRLLDTQCMVLLAFGADKRRIIDSPQGYPVAHVLGQQTVPVRIIWAP